MSLFMYFIWGKCHYHIIHFINMTVVGHYWSVPLNVRGWSMVAGHNSKPAASILLLFTGDSDQGHLFQSIQFSVNYSSYNVCTVPTVI
jgi:hypothetical protein